MLQLIVARARNGVIGGENRMLWHVPEDFRFFKATTMGSPVVMGRKTRESIGRALPGRRNIAVSRRADWHPDGTEVFPTLAAARAAASDGAENVFVIGGGEIYRQSLPQVERAYVTVIDEDFEGDTVFPDLPEAEWTMTVLDRLEPTETRPFAVEFRRYDRR